MRTALVSLLSRKRHLCRFVWEDNIYLYKYNDNEKDTWWNIELWKEKQIDEKKVDNDTCVVTDIRTVQVSLCRVNEFQWEQH